MAIQIVEAIEKGFVHPKGHTLGFQVSNHHVLFTALTTILGQLENKKNIYYTLAHHTELGKDKPSRKEATFEYQSILPFDIDHVDLTRPYDYLTCVAKVLLVDPSTLTLIATGNGFHILAQLENPIRSAKYLKQLKPAYNELLHRIGKELETLGLPGRPDPVVFDAARVFRLPGTINRKPKSGEKGVFEEKSCELLQYSDVSHKIELEVLSGVQKFLDENISPDQIRRQYPKPDFEQIATDCLFVKWAGEHPEEIHEPQVFDLFSLLHAQPPAAKITHSGTEKTGKDLARWVFENASSSKSCARQDFDRKWEDASRYGARKCSTVNSNWEGCRDCKHSGKIATPLALKSPDFISSEDLGFWVLDNKGRHEHPHYSDLARVYTREHSYVTTQDERLFTFGGSHYNETPPLLVKSWLEKKVTPVDPIRESHRQEFVKKINVVGAMTKQSETDLFLNSTEGKLNCKNGVVDIMTGDLRLHDPGLGFQYVLPYDFTPNESSEFFMDWLAEVLLDRDELMEAVLDVMAYCLWPRYDDHIFTYFIGEGSNGKGTLLHILIALMGADNVASISVPQLAQNRFAPANLEGKLANLSEESSGGELSFEELNVIKNLSAGGDMHVERKGIQGYMFRNRAKLIFSANRTPRFKEQGHAIRRRLLAIPFDHTFTRTDPRVEHKLLEEVPKICSMLVRRIQENVKTNGRFVVHRGGKDAYEAQERILLSGNSAIEWAKETIEASAELPEETYIACHEAYSNYVKWCAQNNYAPMNKGLFSSFYAKNIAPKHLVEITKTAKVQGKTIRVYPCTRFKETYL